MKVVKYFLLTVLAIWSAILLVMAFQNRNRNATYRKIKAWLSEEENKESLNKFKNTFGFDLKPKDEKDDLY